MSIIQYIEPDEIRAGDTVEWYKSLSDYPASIWTLTYTLINASAKITITAGASGDTHYVSVASTTTDDYAAGEYEWIAQVTSGSTKKTVGSGWITVLPDLAAATTYDTRSHAQKMLDAIESLLEGRATDDELDLLEGSYDIRSIKRDPSKMLQIRDRYKSEVNAELTSERVKNGKSSNRMIQTRLA